VLLVPDMPATMRARADELKTKRYELASWLQEREDELG
jgi:hypothetical protein